MPLEVFSEINYVESESDNGRDGKWMFGNEQVTVIKGKEKQVYSPFSPLSSLYADPSLPESSVIA